MREFLRVLSGVVVVMFFYSSTILFFYHFEGRSAYSTQLTEIRSIMAALDDYSAAHGSYPVLPVPDSPISALKKELADNGRSPVKLNLSGLQLDPDARYFSADGKSYGLLFHLDGIGKERHQECLIERNARELGWWGQPPECPL
jgi:hypothetical protein